VRVYIAGPMTGLPEFNYPAFHAAEDDWTREGWDVSNPATNFGGDTSRAYRDYIRADLRMLAEADAIAFLPGWRKSKGATFEHAVATMLGLEMYDAETFCRLKDESVLEEAARLTGGDRAASYGDPADDYAATVAGFNAFTRRTGGRALTPAEGALFMCCVKLSREGHAPKRDNRTDLAGYSWVLDKCRQREGA
jgi:hypothetical protein